MIPLTYSFVPAFLFINFLALIGRYCTAMKKLIDTSWKNGMMNEKFDGLNNMVHELNEILRLLSKCFGAFLLASIAAQFITSIHLFYYLFLTFNGLIEFSITTLIPSVAWLFIQFSVLMTFITGCEKVSCELSCFSSTLCHSTIAEKESFRNVRKMFSFKKFLKTLFQVTLLQLLMIQAKPEFNGGKLFPINYQLMTMFFSAIISYLIVIVQFHLQN